MSGMHPPDLRLLLDVRSAGSLSAAAKRSGIAISTLARRLDALEASLKLRLVDRRMNGARLTSDGERIAALAVPVVDGLDRVTRAAAAMRHSAAREAVTVSATEFVIADVLAPAVPLLLSRHRNLALTLRSEAAVVSLAARAADIAVRMSAPEGNSLFGRKLAEQHLGLFASPAYLAGRDPAALDLAAQCLLVYDDSYGRLPELDWLHAGGLDSAVAFRTSSTRALLAATIAGAGIGLLPVVHARAAELAEVPAPMPLPGRAPWLLVHRDLRRVPAIRIVMTWIEEAFRKQGGAVAVAA
jgi:DNA-binding transcriptional LysR family regulator